MNPNTPDVGSEFVVKVKGDGLEPMHSAGDTVECRVVPVADLLHRAWHPPHVSPGTIIYVETASGLKRLKQLRRASERAISIGDVSPRKKHASDTSLTIPTGDVAFVAVVIGKVEQPKGRAAR